MKLVTKPAVGRKMLSCLGYKGIWLWLHLNLVLQAIIMYVHMQYMLSIRLIFPSEDMESSCSILECGLATVGSGCPVGVHSLFFLLPQVGEPKHPIRKPYLLPTLASYLQNTCHHGDYCTREFQVFAPTQTTITSAQGNM